MKQLRIFSVLLMCLFALGFTACGGGDDDENLGGGNGNGNSGGSPTQFEKDDLYGGWKYETGSENTLYYFDDENSGIMIENANSKNYTRSEFAYKINNDVTTLTIIDEGGNKKIYSIFSLTDQKLVFEDADEKSYTLKRYTGNIDEEFPEKVTPKHEAVDLGLSVKWATCNVGAESPEKYGDLFAWGETAPKEEYTEENCKTHGKDLGDISGNREYDAATANWGSDWRMPTYNEMRELIRNCTWEWTIENGVHGYMVTSKVNSNYIFLPAAGYYKWSLHEYRDERGKYWTSSPDGGNTKNAYQYSFLSDRDFCWLRSDVRYIGGSVRPVTD